MRWVALSIAVFAVAAGVTAATVCDEDRCPEGYDCQCTENYAEEIDSDITVHDHQLMYSRDHWNCTGSQSK